MKRYLLLIGLLLILCCGMLTTSQSQSLIYPEIPTQDYFMQTDMVEVIQIVDEETGMVVAAKIVEHD